MNTEKSGIKVGNYILKTPPIGQGGFGKVYLAKDDKNKICAAKVIEISEKSHSRKEKLKQEVKILFKFNNPYIIKLYEFLQTKNNLYIMMEYCDEKTLFYVLHNYRKNFHQPLSLKLIQHFTKQIVAGMYNIQENNIVHRDIKVENIMIAKRNMVNDDMNTNYDANLINRFPVRKSAGIYPNQQNVTENIEIDWSSREKVDDYYMNNTNIKIIDFGLAKELNEEEKSRSFCGTTPFVAPEIFEVRETENAYDKRVDIWSLGCLVFQLYVGHIPFKHEKDMDKKLFYETIKKGEILIDSKLELYAEIIDFLNGTLQINPDDRYTWDEIINHPFLNKNISKFKKIETNSSDILLNLFMKEDYLKNDISENERSQNLNENITKVLNCCINNKLENSYSQTVRKDENLGKIEYDITVNQLKLSNLKEISDAYIDLLFNNDYILVENEIVYREEFLDVENDYVLVNFIK